MLKKDFSLPFLFIFLSTQTIQLSASIIKTLYGPQEITEHVLEELLECPSIQRLKDIHQYGIVHYVCNYPSYSRYDHSIGVLYLLRHFGASLEEQIAGLLHDVSHTVFSHVGDHIFKNNPVNNSYQDDIHLWYLEQTEIPAILAKYGIATKAVLHKNTNFTRLEQDLPNLCADRLEYVLQGGFLEKILTHDDIQFVLKSLKFERNNWFFTNIPAAQKIGYSSLFLTENIFASSWNHVLYSWTAQALNQALKISILTLDDIHFSIDKRVWKTLQLSNDLVIKKLVEKISNYAAWYTEKSVEEEYDMCIHPKFRGINPLIITDMGVYKLTLLDGNFATAFTDLTKKLEHGIYIKFTEN